MKGYIVVHKVADYDRTAKNPDRRVAIPLSAIASVEPRLGGTHISIIGGFYDGMMEIVESFDEVEGLMHRAYQEVPAPRA